MNNSVLIERLEHCSAEDLKQIGTLLTNLSADFLDIPVEQSLLSEIIASPHHAQFVARVDNKIVGIATLSITIGVGAGRKAYLEDFVINPIMQGKGIGSALWSEIVKWCREQHVKLHFTSNAKREAAHRFYVKQGAKIYDTIVFHFDPN